MEEKKASSIEKKIRFRQPAKVLFRQDSKIEDLLRNEQKHQGDMDYSKSGRLIVFKIKWNGAKVHIF